MRAGNLDVGDIVTFHISAFSIIFSYIHPDDSRQACFFLHTTRLIDRRSSLLNSLTTSDGQPSFLELLLDNLPSSHALLLVDWRDSSRVNMDVGKREQGFVLL
jgi:hypothetical protein